MKIKKSNIILIIIALLYITNEVVNYFMLRQVVEQVVEHQDYDNR